MNAFVYPLIVVSGGFPALGAAMNAELCHAVTNPWLAGEVSFMSITCLSFSRSWCALRLLISAGKGH